MLTKEQIAELKQQLSAQIQHLPQDQRDEAQEQIDSMSPETLELMIQQQKPSNQEIFRMISVGDIPSKRVDENKYAIAVLDIKPISKAHTIIIPRVKVTDTNKMPSQAFSLAKKVSSRIRKKYSPTNIDIQTEKKFGEVIINILPSYEKPLTINSPRHDATETDLENVYKTIKAIKRTSSPRAKKSINTHDVSRTLVLKRKIP